MSRPAKKVKITDASADSLEQDFLVEDGFALSDAESEPDAHALLPASEDLPIPSDATASAYEASNKRKAALLAKSTKVKKVKESHSVQEASLGLLNLAELMGKLGEKQKRAMPNASGLEMDEFRIEESMLLDTSSVTERKNLADFLKTAIPGLSGTLAKPPKKAGSPRVLVIAGAALRVADLCREVKVFKSKDIDVGKLFSKHFKLGEHVEYLNKTKVGVAVGTPGRIGKLFSETDALLLTHLSHLVLDVSHLDSKSRSLLDMPEAREDVFKLVLGDKGIMARLREGRMKIVLY